MLISKLAHQTLRAHNPIPLVLPSTVNLPPSRSSEVQQVEKRWELRGSEDVRRRAAA